MKHEIVFLLGTDIDFLENFGERGDAFYDRLEATLELLAKTRGLAILDRRQDPVQISRKLRSRR